MNILNRFLGPILIVFAILLAPAVRAQEPESIVLNLYFDPNDSTAGYLAQDTLEVKQMIGGVETQISFTYAIEALGGPLLVANGMFMVTVQEVGDTSQQGVAVVRWLPEVETPIIGVESVAGGYLLKRYVNPEGTETSEDRVIYEFTSMAPSITITATDVLNAGGGIPAKPHPQVPNTDLFTPADAVPVMNWGSHAWPPPPLVIQIDDRIPDPEDNPWEEEQGDYDWDGSGGAGDPGSGDSISANEGGLEWSMNGPMSLTDSAANESPSDGCDAANSYTGMARYWIDFARARFGLRDMPLTYRPAFGPAMPVVVTYREQTRDAVPIPGVSRLDRRWTVNWMQYVVERPAGAPITQVGPHPELQGFQFNPETVELSPSNLDQLLLQVKIPAPTFELYHGNGASAVFRASPAVLLRINQGLTGEGGSNGGNGQFTTWIHEAPGAQEIPWPMTPGEQAAYVATEWSASLHHGVFTKQADGSLVRRLASGVQEIYAGGTGGKAVGGRIVRPLVAIVSPDGQAITLDWDGLRLMTVRDATGKTLTFTYDETDPEAADALDRMCRVQSIVDPFGRTARFSYDAHGRMTGITDAAGIVSGFGYPDPGPEDPPPAVDDRVMSLQTPLGLTQFSRLATAGVESGFEITGPDNEKVRVELRESTPALQSLIDTEPHDAGSEVNLTLYNTFYWDKRAMGNFNTASPDYAAATIYNWALFPQSATNAVPAMERISGLPRSIKRAGLARVYFYFSASLSNEDDTTTLPERSLPRYVRVVELGEAGVRQVAHTWNDKNRPLGFVDELGRATSYSYHPAPAGEEWREGLDLWKVSVTPQGGTGAEVVARYENYQAAGRAGEYYDAANQKTAIAYNEHGQVDTVTDALGVKTKRTYHATVGTPEYGRVASVTGNHGSTTSTPAVTSSYGYDGQGRVSTIARAGNELTTLAYDAVGGDALKTLDRVRKVTYPDGTFEEVEFSGLLVKKSWDRLRRLTTYEHDELGRVSSVTDPAGREVRFNRWSCCEGSNAPVEELVDAKGKVTKWDRDAAGRTTAKTIDGSVVASYGYSARTGWLAWETDANGNRKEYDYFADGQPAGVRYVTLGAGVAATSDVSFTYDGYGRQATMSDGTGFTMWTYHPFPTATAGQLGAGEVAAVTKRTALGGTVLNELAYEYDELGRLLSRTVGLTGDAGTESYDYDELGRLRTMLNPLSAQASGPDVPFGWSYAGPGNRLSEVAYPNGMKTTLGYGEIAQGRRLAGLTHWKPGSAGMVSSFDYTWDAGGRLTEWGQTHTPGAGGSVTRRGYYGYNDADELVQAVVKNQGGIETDRWLWDYDKAGNRLSEQHGSAVTKWTVNGFNQLGTQSGGGLMELRGTVDRAATVTVGGKPASVDAQTLEWTARVDVVEGANNVPLTATEVEGVGGPAQTVHGKVEFTVPAAAPKTLSYDGNGNLLSDGTQTYTWDAENRMVSVAPVATGGSWMGSTFAYDGMWRRVSITDSGVQRRFTWDDLEIVEERNASDALVKRFWGVGEERASLKLFYTRDHLGSVREVLDETGAIRARYAYDEWGQRAKLEGDLDCDFGFTGHFEHGLSGITFAPYRPYRWDLARWLSPDPIGEEGGLNLYHYTYNTPVSAYDPLGLDTYQQNRQLAAVGGKRTTNYNPISHTFVFTTKPDGTVDNTYSWGNTGKEKGWTKNAPEDRKAAEDAISEGYNTNRYGGEDLDPYVDKAFDALDKKANEHSNGILSNNCKYEADKLIDLARKMKQNDEYMRTKKKKRATP